MKKIRGRRHRWILNVFEDIDQCENCGLFRSRLDVHNAFMTKNGRVEIKTYAYAMRPVGKRGKNIGAEAVFHVPSCPPAEPVKKVRRNSFAQGKSGKNRPEIKDQAATGVFG